MDNIIDYIIIGCGISGLNLGVKIKNKIKNKNKKCYIFEKSSIIGGRVQTIYKKNYIYESGAARFNHNHKNLISLLKKYNLYGEKVEIPSFWETILINNKNNELNNLNIHRFIEYIINLYNNKKYKNQLQNSTIYEFVKEILNETDAKAAFTATIADIKSEKE